MAELNSVNDETQSDTDITHATRDHATTKRVNDSGVVVEDNSRRASDRLTTQQSNSVTKRNEVTNTKR